MGDTFLLRPYMHGIVGDHCNAVDGAFVDGASWLGEFSARILVLEVEYAA